MRVFAIIAALVSLLALTSVAGEAAAQSRSRAPAVSLAEAAAAQRSASAQSATAPRRGLRWRENGRWGLNFNLTEPTSRDAQFGDVEAGAYYRLNPRLSVGAAAGLAPTPPQDPVRAPEADRRAPRIRLESIFKF